MKINYPILQLPALEWLWILRLKFRRSLAWKQQIVFGRILAPGFSLA
jgi:hypothetical protein